MTCDSCEALHAETTGLRVQLDGATRAAAADRMWLHTTPLIPAEVGVYWAREKGGDWRIVFVLKGPHEKLEYWDDGEPLGPDELSYYAEWSGKIPVPA